MKRNNSLKLISVFLVLTMLVGMLGIFAVSADGDLGGGSNPTVTTYAATSADIADVTYTDTWDGTSDTAWYTEAIAADPDTAVFEIDTAEELAGLATLVDGGNAFAGLTVKVAANLDMAKPNGEPNEWNPIGVKATKAFNGNLEGKDGMVYIKNITMNSSTSDHSINGFITCQKGGGVKNLTLVDPVLNISGEIANNGILIGAINGNNVTLENVGVINGKITVAANTTKANGIGGLVGLVNNGTAVLNNCDADVTIDLKEDVTNEVLGGVFGIIRGTVSPVDCDANLTVIANNGQEPLTYYAAVLGGVAGEVKDNITFTNSDVKLNGTLKGGGQVAGIFATTTSGSDPVVNITDCSVSGELTFEGDASNIGGFGATLTKTGVVTGSKSALTINVNGNATNVGGLFAEVTGIKVQQSEPDVYKYTTISDTEVSGSINVKGEATNVGAVAGTVTSDAQLLGVKVTKEARVDVTGKATKLGGIAGTLSENAVVSECEVATVVNAHAAKSSMIGGVAGLMESKAIVEKSTVTAAVSALDRQSHAIGGVSGSANGEVQVVETTVSGVIAAGKHTYATGGIFGELTGSDAVTILKSTFNGGLTSAGHTVGGLVGTTAAPVNIQLSRVENVTITASGLKYTMTEGTDGSGNTTYTVAENEVTVNNVKYKGTDVEKNVGGLVGLTSNAVTVQGTEVVGTTINVPVGASALKYEKKISPEGEILETAYLNIRQFTNANDYGLNARVGGAIGYNNNANTTFGKFSAGNVSNRIQVTINTGKDANYTGGVVGLSGSKLTVRDTAVDVTMTFTGNTKHIGGVVGKASTLIAENLTIRMNVDAPNRILTFMTGVHGWWGSTSSVYRNCNIIMNTRSNTNGAEAGIAGLLPGMNNAATIENCAVAGRMSFLGTGAYRSGGLLGGINACTQVVSNCVVTVDMVHENIGSANPNLHQGGIAGEIRAEGGDLTLNNCYYGGHIISETGKRVGGIVGFVLGNLTMNNVQMDGVVSVNSTQNGGFIGRLDTKAVTLSADAHKITFNNCLMSGISKNSYGLENGVGWIGTVANMTATTYNDVNYEIKDGMDWAYQDGKWVKIGNDDIAISASAADLKTRRLELIFDNCYSTYEVSFAPSNDVNSAADTIAVDDMGEGIYSVNGVDNESHTVTITVNGKVVHNPEDRPTSNTAYMAIKCAVVPQEVEEKPAEGDNPAVEAVSAKDAMIAGMNYTYTPSKANPDDPDPAPVVVSTFDFVGVPDQSIDPIWTIKEGAVYPILTCVVKKDNIDGVKLYNDALLGADMTWFKPGTVNYTVNSDEMMVGMARFTYGMALTKVYKFDLQVNQITSVDLSLYADGYIASVAPQLLLLTVHYQFNADKTQLRLISTLASNQYSAARFEFLKDGKKIIASARPPETNTVYTSIQGGGNTYTASDFSAAGTCIFVSTMNIAELGLEADDVITIQATYVTLKGVAIRGLAYTATYAEMLAACGM